MNNIINTLYSSLGQEEVYDATRLNIWSFKKSCDIINGVQMKLSNMAGGFPFVFNKVMYSNNEVLYLSGEFSENTFRYLGNNKFRSMSHGGVYTIPKWLVVSLM